MPNQAIFYPYIDICDDSWLKSALLYWDEIRTVVPASIDHPYRTNTTEFLADAGLLTPIRVSPQMEEVESLSELVLTYLSTNEGARLIANSRHRSSTVHAERLVYKFKEYAKLHLEKLPFRIQEELRHSIREEDGWFQVDTGFADFYMTVLASKLSVITGASLVTGDFMADDLAISMHLDAPLGQQLDDIVSGDRRYWRRHRRHREYEAHGRRRSTPAMIGEGLLANLALSRIGISPYTPIQDILTFKNSHRDELGHFHGALSELCKGLDGDMPIEAIRERVGSIYINEVLPAVNDLKAALTGKRIQWKAEGLLKVSFMTASSFSALAVAGLSTPIAILAGAGISLTGMAVLHNIEKQKEVRSSPFAYLLSVESSL